MSSGMGPAISSQNAPLFAIGDRVRDRYTLQAGTIREVLVVYRGRTYGLVAGYSYRLDWDDGTVDILPTDETQLEKEPYHD